jgi:putative SOS response-associated peptidase YedK
LRDLFNRSSFFLVPCYLFLQPQQVARTASHHGHGENLGDFVGVEAANRLLDRVVLVTARFGPALPLLGRFDRALPTVRAADGPDDLHAGRQPAFHQRAGDPIGVLALGNRGNDLDVFGHTGANVSRGPTVGNGVKERTECADRAVPLVVARSAPYNAGMCGRFTLRVAASVIAEQFAVLDMPPFAARFNIATTQLVPVVRMRPDQGEPWRELVWLRWGLIPSWATDPAIGGRLINARAETAATKPAFRAALRRRRCLVVADGFYEWQRSGRAKQPYFIHLRDDRPFAFAGLWDAWEGPDQALLETCTLLTTEANPIVRPIHDRMPVILPAESHTAWIDPTIEEPKRLTSLLVPYPADQMVAYPVGTLVNSPRHEAADCIKPAQGRLF